VKLTVLVDNNTFIDKYYLGEPGASFCIEEDGCQVLLDVGYSNILLSNAEKMGIDLSKTTHIVLSHGHDDHTQGLPFLKEAVDLSGVKLIAHPAGFLPKFKEGKYIGGPYSEQEIAEIADYMPMKEPHFITEKLLYLGEIPRKTDFENKTPIGQYEENGERKDDYLPEDTALVYKGEKGLFIISGCSHSGICNIIEYAKEVCETDKVYGVLGGFHLRKEDEQLTETITYLEKLDLEVLYPCHCVGLFPRFRMMEKLPVVETGVGMVLEIH